MQKFNKKYFKIQQQKLRKKIHPEGNAAIQLKRQH